MRAAATKLECLIDRRLYSQFPGQEVRGEGRSLHMTLFLAMSSCIPIGEHPSSSSSSDISHLISV